MLRKIANVSVVVLLTVFSSHSAIPAENLSPELIHKVVHETSEVLESQYIFSEVGETMARALISDLENGDYDNVSSVAEFTTVLRNRMRELSNDEHLNFFYNDAGVTTEEEYLNPTPELQAENAMMHKYFNSGIRSVGRLDGNIGYFDLSGFMEAEPTAQALGTAMNLVQNTGGLIIDLRKNYGGMPEAVALLASYFLGPSPTHVDSIYWKKTDITQEFWTTTDLDGAWYGLERPVIILTSDMTFSAAEAFSYAMKAFERAEIVGETTRGGAHPGGIQRIVDDFYLWLPNGRAINAVTGENWEGTGISPDYPVSADEALDTAHKIILKAVIPQTDFILDRQDREMHLRRLDEGQ